MIYKTFGKDKRYLFGIKWEPRDLWMGLYIKTADTHRTFYLCLLPTLPIVFQVIKPPAKRQGLSVKW